MRNTVTIPNWEASYLKSENTRAKYWLWKDREKLPKKYSTQLSPSPLIKGTKAYCADIEGNRFVKNTKKVGTQNRWILNGQDLYNATLNWRLRKSIAKYYHEYFSRFIQEQLTPITIPEGKFLSIGCDIYEVKRGNMPDISNMWLLEKFFEDALQECGIIPDDNSDYVIESGRKRYHFVETADDRKLVFTINLVE
tara:strand:- start:25833 stop:26417 length:585 start_codon:yes stop_codon:yes gene_type:complete